MAREVEPETQKDVSARRAGRPRPLHTLAVVGVGVVGVLIAFWVLSSIVGVVAELVKVVVILAVVAGLVWLVFGRRRR
jgi:Flp pilus assembly protein TadB